MNNFSLTIVLVFLSAFSVFGQELFSTESYDEVVLRAEKEKKPYYIDFTASWCFPCKQMDSTVFKDTKVIQYTHSHYIAKQLDTEDFDALILKGEYNVTQLPTILIFDSKGKLLKKLVGLQTGTNFLKILKEYSFKS